MVKRQPRTESSYWVGERAHRYEYKYDDWEEYLDMAKGAKNEVESLKEPGSFVVHHEKKAGKLWYLMPFDVNVKIEHVDQNMVFQRVG